MRLTLTDETDRRVGLDPAAIDSDEVWVLHAEGHYVVDHVGDDTYYYRD